MKTQHLTSFIAIGAILPLAAWADDIGSKSSLQREAYDPRPSETRSGPPSARADDTTRDRTLTRSRTDMDAAQTTLSHTAGAGIECVSKDQVEQRVTAADLIGTRVLDREGREIGKVKDIGLGSVAPQLSEAQAATRDSSSPARGTSSGLSQPWTQSDERETRVFVRPDRALDAGDALVAIPATQLHREGDTLRVDISREELRSIVAESASSRVSMNK